MFKVNNELKKLGSLIVNVGFDIYIDVAIDQFSFFIIIHYPAIHKCLWLARVKSIGSYVVI